ncbi:MAG: hypothetical protein KF893_05305 [Caldilineaceae bacterium]|nr:hypothetical protein [Caldilineaceae bacterium]
MRESHTAVLERNVTWTGAFEIEPYETAWAGEAIYFVRALDVLRIPSGYVARVQISPDGIHWCDEGTELPLPNQPDEVTFARVRRFGGWLRAVGELPADASLTVIVYLTLKE